MKKIAVTREKISSLNDDIKEKQDAYDKGLSEVEDQFDALANRLRILYMSGNATDLEIIFGAKDFSDLIDKMELVKSLANSDKGAYQRNPDKAGRAQHQEEIP